MSRVRASRTGRRRKSPDMCSIPHGPSQPIADTALMNSGKSKIPSPQGSRFVEGVLEVGAYHVAKPIVELHAEDDFRRHERRERGIRRTTAVRMPNIE